MEVILKKDLPDLGRIGDVVRVREGYARNFLIPRSLAVVASSANKKYLSHQKRLVEDHKKKVRKDSEARLGDLKGVSIKIEKRFNESGKMFGAVSAADIATELKKINIEVDRRSVNVESLKDAGTHQVEVRLPGDVLWTLKVEIEAKVEKAAKEPKKARSKSKKTDEKSAEETVETAATEVSE